MSTRKQRSDRGERAKMRSRGGLLFCIDRSGDRSGKRSPPAARATWQREDLGFHRRSGLDGFGSVEVWPHRNLPRRHRRRRGAICRWLSVSKSLSCGFNVTGFARSRGNWRVPRRRSRVSCDATPPPEADASSIERSRRSGMPIVRHDVLSVLSWRSVLCCGTTSKTGWRARSPLLVGRWSLAPR